jgi:hypothetical protein
MRGEDLTSAYYDSSSSSSAHPSASSWNHRSAPPAAAPLPRGMPRREMICISESGGDGSSAHAPPRLMSLRPSPIDPAGTKTGPGKVHVRRKSRELSSSTAPSGYLYRHQDSTGYPLSLPSFLPSLLASLLSQRSPLSLPLQLLRITIRYTVPLRPIPLWIHFPPLPIPPTKTPSLIAIVPSQICRLPPLVSPPLAIATAAITAIALR